MSGQFGFSPGQLYLVCLCLSELACDVSLLKGGGFDFSKLNQGDAGGFLDRGFEFRLQFGLQLLEVFQSLGAANPDVIAARRKLSTLLFS